MRRSIIGLAVLCLLIALPASTLGSQAKSFGIRDATAFFVAGDLESECGATEHLILTVADGPQGPNQQGPGTYFMWFDIQYWSEMDCERVEGSYHQGSFDLAPDIYTINGLAAAWVETPVVDVDGRQFSFDLAWISQGPLYIDIGNGVSQAYDAHLTGTVYDSAGLITEADLDYASIDWHRIIDN
jgi:hypothetical protein